MDAPKLISDLCNTQPANDMATSSVSNPFHLERFLEAQDAVYPMVLRELAHGHKQSHWMWFIFPQLRGLGYSDMADYYGISGVAEARAYGQHALLGARLRQCCRAILQNRDRPIADILGETDARKLRSCMTLFARADAKEPLFREVLETFFAGREDPLTVNML